MGVLPPRRPSPLPRLPGAGIIWSFHSPRVLSINETAPRLAASQVRGPSWRAHWLLGEGGVSNGRAYRPVTSGTLVLRRGVPGVFLFTELSSSTCSPAAAGTLQALPSEPPPLRRPEVLDAARREDKPGGDEAGGGRLQRERPSAQMPRSKSRAVANCHFICELHAV